MSDATTSSTPIIDAVRAAVAPSIQTPAAPSAPAPEAPKVEAAKPAEAPKTEASKPPRLHPYAKRDAAPAKPAAAPAAPSQPTAPAAAEAPKADDPRIASMSSELEALRGVLSRQAATELAALPENVRKYVETAAGDSPAKRLDMVAMLRASGLVTAPAAVPPGATTLPQAPLPPAQDATATTEASVLAEYERLAKSSPILASNFERSNRAVINRARERASRN